MKLRTRILAATSAALTGAAMLLGNMYDLQDLREITGLAYRSRAKVQRVEYVVRKAEEPETLKPSLAETDMTDTEAAQFAVSAMLDPDSFDLPRRRAAQHADAVRGARMASMLLSHFVNESAAVPMHSPERILRIALESKATLARARHSPTCARQPGACAAAEDLLDRTLRAAHGVEGDGPLAPRDLAVYQYVQEAILKLPTPESPAPAFTAAEVMALVSPNF
jgi:hypothetical protein